MPGKLCIDFHEFWFSSQVDIVSREKWLIFGHPPLMGKGSFKGAKFSIENSTHGNGNSGAIKCSAIAR